jgi:biotin transport system substrate-specific component
VLATGLVGWVAERGGDRSFLKLFAAMSVGTVLILACGFVYLASIIGVEQAWIVGVMPFLLAGLFKTAIAALVVPAVGRLFGR